MVEEGQRLVEEGVLQIPELSPQWMRNFSPITAPGAGRCSSGVPWRSSRLQGQGSAETPGAPRRFLVRCGTKSLWLPLSSLPAEVMIRLGESFGITLILCVENGSDMFRPHLLPVTRG